MYSVNYLISDLIQSEICWKHSSRIDYLTKIDEIVLFFNQKYPKLWIPMAHLLAILVKA